MYDVYRLYCVVHNNHSSSLYNTFSLFSSLYNIWRLSTGGYAKYRIGTIDVFMHNYWKITILKKYSNWGKNQ